MSHLPIPQEGKVRTGLSRVVRAVNQYMGIVQHQQLAKKQKQTIEMLDSLIKLEKIILSLFTQARVQGHSSWQQAALPGSVQHSPFSSISNGPTLVPTPTNPQGINVTTQKVTLKKSLFKKVLAARTVTKQKERLTNKTGGCVPGACSVLQSSSLYRANMTLRTASR